MERSESNLQSTPVTDRPQGSPLEQEMTGTGRLLFQVSTAGGAIPLSDAEVTVRRLRSPNGEQESGGEVIAVLYTDENGKTRALPLPAPDRTLAQSPRSDGSPLPYSLYDADVYMEGFYRQSYSRIPVFDGITSIQHATLIPLPDNGVPDGARPDDEIIVEGEPSDL